MDGHDNKHVGMGTSGASTQTKNNNQAPNRTSNLVQFSKPKAPRRRPPKPPVSLSRYHGTSKAASPLPFLVPQKAMSTCHIFDQFTIPKETQVLVNVWVIGRDPETWIDLIMFKPERFISDPNPRDFKGQDFKFLQFGSGRRMCPALPLASRVLPLAIGSMVRLFNWALTNGLDGEEIDMGERIGITLKKVVPLETILIPYRES